MDKGDKITVVAVLKSVIESGADVKDWNQLTRDGLAVYGDIVRNPKKENNNG